MLMVLVVTCNCRFAEKRRNQRKLTPKGGGNPPKSGDDRIGQVFVCVIAGSNGFERVAGLPCSRSGWCEKRSSMIGECAFFGYFFKFLALTVRIPLFKRTGHTQKSGLIFRLLEGLSGLPCSGSGGCEKRPFMIHEGAFFGYFFIFLAPTVRLPLFKCA